MDVDSYRLAYNVFHCNWEKFGIPSEDIPPPKTETIDSLDPIIPGFSIAVVLYQIASRKNLKAFLDNECVTAHNLNDVYTRFENIMEVALPKNTVVVGIPNDDVDKDLSEDATSEDISQATTEEYLSESSMEIDVQKDIHKEMLPNTAKEESFDDTKKEGACNDSRMQDASTDVRKEGACNDAMKEDARNGAIKKDIRNGGMKKDARNGSIKKSPLKDAIKEGLLEDDMQEAQSENTICSEDIPSLIAYSLAVCVELVLYERENENNKDHMKYMPEMWQKYFAQHLQPLCIKARCTQDNLKSYTDSLQCPEKFLNRFIADNKGEYNDIADKFYDYTEKNYAEKSPEHIRFMTEIKSISKGISFLKIKKKFTAIKEICKCIKSMPIDEVPLLSDFSPCSSSSTPTTPST